MKQAKKLTKLTTGALIAVVMVGCSTLQPGSVDGLDRVIGDELPGAKGKTAQDQGRIDSVIARGCATRLFSKDECDAHTDASASRFEELKRADQEQVS